MNELTITLTGPLAEYAIREAAARGYPSPAAFVEVLIREEQRRRAEQDRLEQLLLEGLNSGDPVEVDEAFWAERRRRLEERLRVSAEP